MFQLLQAAQQRLKDVEKLLPLAHRYRTMLQALSPQVLTTATGSADGGKKAKKGGKGDKDVQDPLAELAKLADDIRQYR